MSEKLRRYQQAMDVLDIDTLGELRHPDYECFYPQSGERFIGHDDWAAAHKDYESRFSGAMISEATVKGGKVRAEVTQTASPVFFATPPVIQLSGSRDLATLEGRGLWPDGKIYHWVFILEFKDGLVWRETQYFAEPFDAPDWRAPFTDLGAD